MPNVIINVENDSITIEHTVRTVVPFAVVTGPGGDVTPLLTGGSALVDVVADLAPAGSTFTVTTASTTCQTCANQAEPEG
jgi:hypothetical protein